MDKVQTIIISVVWKKNRTWGRNPHAEAHVIMTDGTQETLTERCSGCGYDKLSEVVADILNRTTLKDMLKKGDIEAPYGMQHGYFEGGIGMVCYEDHDLSYGKQGILQYLGYSCKHFPGKDTDFILIERKKDNENNGK